MTQKKSKSVTAFLLQFSLMATPAGLLILLPGCDSGNKATQQSASANTTATLGGLVKDQHGPIYDALIEVHDSTDKVVAKTRLTGQSDQYSVTVPAGTSYPIVLVATPPEGSMRAPVKAVINSSLADTMDISDVSTLVVDLAIGMGGLTEANIAKASGGAIGLRQRQGVSAGAGGGGAGAGQSGGGVGHGGHGGHDMSGMGGSTGSTDGSGSSSSGDGMKH